MLRRRYQFGWIERQRRSKGPDVWVWRCREKQPDGKTKKTTMMLGNVEQLESEAHAWTKAEHLRLSANPENPRAQTISFGALVDRYIGEELPQLRHSTAKAYRSHINNHIKPKWGEHPIGKVKAFAVEEWLKSLPIAPKTRGNIHAVMRVLFDCAMRWELIEIGDNPMRLVRVRGVSKRQSEPTVLTVKQCQHLLEQIHDEPFRTMIILDMATGLRCSELLALKWCDFDWASLTLLIRRAIVDGVVDEVKTKYSKAGLPLDPALAELLWAWKQRSPFGQDNDWVFASPFQRGEMPYRPWGIQQRYLKSAGLKARVGEIGWHTFRHTFSSMLRSNGEDVKVQQELLRHADVRTTLNIYTQAVSDQKRQAHSKVVRMVLPNKVRATGS